MIRNFSLRAGALMGAALVLASCQMDAPSVSRAGHSTAGFKTKYLVARQALEGGQYAKASRQYADLLRRAGPLESRLRLEYAHSLLRDGKYDRAGTEARKVAGQLRGPGRSAALAVQATADQEVARAAIARGRMGTQTVERLMAARVAFDELLSKNPELDPLGAMALRRKLIDSELASIR